METEKLDGVIKKNVSIAKKAVKVHVQEIYKAEEEKAFKSMDNALHGWRNNKKLVNKIKHGAHQTAKNKVSAFNIGYELELPAQDVMNYGARLKKSLHCSTDVAFDIIRKRKEENIDLLKLEIISKDKGEKEEK